MLDAINSFCLWITDPVLGWLLHLHRDAALFIVAIGTAMILTVVRLFTTNQGMLRRCKADHARLKQLIRQAKSRRDKEAVNRHRLTIQQIQLKKFAAEGKPLLASLVPIALIAVWCFSNIASLPPRQGQPVTVRAYFDLSEVGDLVYLLPQGGVEMEPGPFRRVRENRDPNHPDQKATEGVAEWTLRCQKRDQPYLLTLRHSGKTYRPELRVDGVRYSTPIQVIDEKTFELVLPEYKLFRLVPGIPQIALQPWIVGYLVIVIPFSVGLKPLLRIH